MQKKDIAHEQTDKELEALERRISAEYGKAAKELQDKIDDYFAKFEKRDAELKKKLDAGEITEDYYKQWRLAQMGRGKRFEALRDRVAERMTKANETAAAYINDATPGLYSINRNYAAYTIEQQVGADVGFDLWDEQTVKRLLVEQPDLMPYYPPERAVKRGIDLKWGKQQITAQVTSGILQGESIKHLSDRLQKNIPDMNRTSAIRAARTAVTGAQNAGRMDSYEAASKMGIKLKKSWLATLDGRTRHEHAMLDGQTVDTDKPFKIDGYELMFPGDPRGPAHLVYNCRCTTIAVVDGVDTSDAQRRARGPETGRNVLIEDMSYSEWAGWKKDEAGSGTALNGDRYSKLPITLGGVERGEPMSFAEADNRAANPGYRKGTGTAENCQSCVVAHEARMRGYDVEAQSYSKNKTAEMLASDTRLAWVDPKTRDVPDFEPWDYKKQYDKRSYKEYLESTVETDGRYTLEFKWKNATGGHIISVDRDETGAIRIYDPQTGKAYSKWEQDDLLGRMRYTDKYGRLDPPHLLRVDTLAFREDIMPDIVKEERAGWKRKAKADMEDDDDWIPF